MSRPSQETERSGITGSMNDQKNEFEQISRTGTERVADFFETITSLGKISNSRRDFLRGVVRGTGMVAGAAAVIEGTEIAQGLGIAHAQEELSGNSSEVFIPPQTELTDDLVNELNHSSINTFMSGEIPAYLAQGVELSDDQVRILQDSGFIDSRIIDELLAQKQSNADACFVEAVVYPDGEGRFFIGGLSLRVREGQSANVGFELTEGSSFTLDVSSSGEFQVHYAIPSTEANPDTQAKWMVLSPVAKNFLNEAEITVNGNVMSFDAYPDGSLLMVLVDSQNRLRGLALEDTMIIFGAVNSSEATSTPPTPVPAETLAATATPEVFDVQDSPVVENETNGTYEFYCFIDQIISDSIDLGDGLIAKYSALCTLRTSDNQPFRLGGNEQSLLIPLSVYNTSNHRETNIFGVWNDNEMNLAMYQTVYPWVQGDFLFVNFDTDPAIYGGTTHNTPGEVIGTWIPSHQNDSVVSNFVRTGNVNGLPRDASGAYPFILSYTPQRTER